MQQECWNRYFAGSVSNLMKCFQRVVKDMNVPLTTAIKIVAVNPAKSIGVYDKYGSIEKGKYADIVLLDKVSEIKYIISKGKIINS